MNGRFFKVLKGPMKPDYFVALLFGCSLLTWPFVKLALKDLCSPDGGLKMIIKDLLTLLFPFSVKRVKMATLNEVWCPIPHIRTFYCEGRAQGCIQGIFFLFVLFILFDFPPWVKVAYLKPLVHCKFHECAVWCYTGKDNLWCNCSDVSMCADKQTQSVGLGGSIADDLWRRWNVWDVNELCLFDSAQPRQKKWSALACRFLWGKMLGHVKSHSSIY